MLENRIASREASIRRGIFQKNSVSPSIFLLKMIPFSEIFHKTKLAYDLRRGKEKLNHLLCMDDLKLFTKKTLRQNWKA